MNILDLRLIINGSSPITILDDYHPYDIANALLELTENERKSFYKLIDNESLAEILSYIEDTDIEDIITEMSDIKSAKIIAQMEPDDAADVIGELEDDKAQNIIKMLDDESKAEIINLVQYDENSSGSIMNTNFISVPSSVDVKEAMRVLVKNAPDVESINTIFVCDKDNKLLGTIDLKTLIISKTPCSVDDIMNDNFKFINVYDSKEEATKLISDYDIFDLPVLNNGIILGIITMDDAIDSITEEASDDYAKLAGLTEEENQDESVISSVKKRMPWLAILLILDVFVSSVTSIFDFLFQEPYLLTVLVIFQPVILGLAGNSGTQSLAVTIRKLSNNELSNNKYIFKQLGKEFLLGLFSGLILAILSFGLSYGLLYINKDFNNPILMISLIVSLAVFISLTLANFFGAVIPIIFYKFKVDPAVASGPFITTINDIISIITYFTLATILLTTLL